MLNLWSYILVKKKNKFEGSQLTQLLGICDFIAKIKYSELIEVSNEEFIKRCNEATTLDTHEVK